MKALTNLMLCLAIVAGTCHVRAGAKQAGNVRNQAFETELKQVMDSFDVVGLSIAVVKGNKIVYTGSYGVQDIDTRVPVSENTFFRIASISKSFSATAIMQLVEKGRVTLDTDVNDLLPFEVRNPKFPDVPITVEMLLCHTSSLNDKEGYWETLNCIIPERNKNYANAYNDYKPGTKHYYCNLNFTLLGSIIEALTGERFDRYVAAHILTPLGLDASFNLNDIPADKIAKLYSWRGEKFVEENAYRPLNGLESYQLIDDAVKFSPAGGMKISAVNLAKYMMMHMNYGKSPLAKTRVLKKKSAKVMQVDHTPGSHYGLALDQTDAFTPGEVMVGHTGGAYGLRSAMYFNPAKKHGLVMICSGCNNPSQVIEAIMPVMHRHFLK